jgi:hypothetical protein
MFIFLPTILFFSSYGYVRLEDKKADEQHQANLLGNQDENDGDDEGGVGKKKKRKDAKKRKRESGGDEPVA